MKRATLHSLLIAGVLLAPAAAIVGLAWERHERIAGREQVFNRQRADAQALLSALRAEAGQAHRHATRYARLGRDGVVGTLDKLALIDRFERSVAPWHGEILRYALSGRASATAAGAERLLAHDLQVLRLSVELMPRHEQALATLLAAVREGIGGISDIERCEITRSGEHPSDGLKATCSIAWHVFVPRAPAPLAGVRP